MTTTAKLGEHLRALRRRSKALIVTAAAGIIVTALLAFLWPPTFRSSAVILIEQQEVPQDLVRSTITSYADQRVQMISQRVMTTSNLLNVIHKYGLYPEEQKTEPREVLVSRMRSDIRMNMISADVIDPRSGRPTQATIAFSVAYDSRSPDLALKVANELTTLYLNENLSSRTQLTRDTASFLAAQSHKLEEEITGLEQKLAEFKKGNVDNLPELAQLNFQMMDRTEQELREIDARTVSLKEQETYLEAQLAQINPSSQLMASTGERILTSSDRLKTLRTQLASLTAVYAADHPDVLRVKREMQGLEKEAGSAADANDIGRRLDQARGELAAARDKYSADHPDVKRLERTVSGLEESLAAAQKMPAQSEPVDADNPAYIQIRAQLEGVRNERQSLTGRSAVLRTKLAAFENKLARSPEIEREYRGLSRDYENAQRKYQEVRAKQMEAELAQNLETDRKGERFTLIEPPLPPEKPVSPNRLSVLLLGILLSLAAGIGSVAVREMLDSTIRSRKDLIGLLTVPPLAVIPRIVTSGEKDKSRRRLRRTAFAAAGAVVLLVLAVHFFIRPLDVLWLTTLRRFGV